MPKRKAPSADDPKPDDPTQDPEFQSVVKHFLNTPHKEHAPLKRGIRQKAAQKAKPSQ